MLKTDSLASCQTPASFSSLANPMPTLETLDQLFYMKYFQHQGTAGARKTVAKKVTNTSWGSDDVEGSQNVEGQVDGHRRRKDQDQQWRVWPQRRQLILIQLVCRGNDDTLRLAGIGCGRALGLLLDCGHSLLAALNIDVGILARRGDLIQAHIGFFGTDRGESNHEAKHRSQEESLHAGSQAAWRIRLPHLLLGGERRIASM
mmetsp:Transcript_74471/g.174735  ORF Transcript_74471/g.174735 Transcript_74471/m.174735 type:complete len:203 (-) Transcript_74471:188-796(-)